MPSFFFWLVFKNCVAMWMPSSKYGVFRQIYRRVCGTADDIHERFMFYMTVEPSHLDIAVERRFPNGSWPYSVDKG